VLVDESGPGAAVTHPVHQFAEACALVAGEIVSGVAKVVELSGIPLHSRVSGCAVAHKFLPTWTAQDGLVRTWRMDFSDGHANSLQETRESGIVPHRVEDRVDVEFERETVRFVDCLVEPD